jgi:hypothetical protein
MIDTNLWKQYYETQEEIRRVENENNERKTAVKLAILKVVSLGFPVDSVASNDEVAGLKKRINEFELYVNKMKQENSTKYRLLDGKFEASKREVAKLKQQLSSRKSKVSEPEPPKPRKLSRPVSLSSRNVLRNYLSPSFNSITEMNEDISANILTPIAPRHQGRKRKYITALNWNQFEKEVVSNASMLPEVPEGTSGASGATSATGSPFKTPSKMKFIANFDKSENDSDSDTPEFTPTKTLSTSTPTENKSGDITAGDTSSEESCGKKKKAKRLVLKRSVKTNILTSPRRLMPLDYDDLNAQNYDDENFLANVSPKHPHLAKVSTDDEPVVKKKKNIFHID